MFLRFPVLPLLGLALLIVIFRHRIAHTWPKRADLPRFLLCALVIGHVLHISAVDVRHEPLDRVLVVAGADLSQPLFTLAILACAGRRAPAAGSSSWGP